MSPEAKRYIAAAVIIIVIIVIVVLGLTFGLPGKKSSDLSDTVALKVVDAQGNTKTIAPAANDIKTDTSASVVLPASSTSSNVVFTPIVPGNFDPNTSTARADVAAPIAATVQPTPVVSSVQPTQTMPIVPIVTAPAGTSSPVTPVVSNTPIIQPAPLVNVTPVVNTKYPFTLMGNFDACAPGLNKIDGNCYKSTSICPSGTTLKNGQCVGSCSGTVIGSTCYKNATKCPDGTTLYNGACWKCNPGDKLAGDKCLITPKCPKDFTLKSGLCYPVAPAGFVPDTVPNGFVQKCPDGWADNKISCIKPQKYPRPAYPTEKDCLAKNSQGCDKVGNLYYPKCKHGFVASGCCSCNSDCIAAGLGAPTGPGLNACLKKKTVMPPIPAINNMPAIKVPFDVGTPVKIATPEMSFQLSECSNGMKYNGKCYKKCESGFAPNMSTGQCVKSTEYMRNGGVLSIFSKTGSGAEHFVVTEHFVIPPRIKKIFAIKRDGTTARIV